MQLSQESTSSFDDVKIEKDGSVASFIQDPTQETGMDKLGITGELILTAGAFSTLAQATATLALSFLALNSF